MKATNQQMSNGWVETVLENDHGMCLTFLNFGGIVTELVVPDKRGVRENVVLSYADLSHYKENKPYFGALIGPVAGRIKDACFMKNGTRHTLSANDGHHHLHGGGNGLHQQLFSVTLFQHEDRVGAMLTAEEMEMDHYPGKLTTTITYIITNENEWIIDYHATVDEMMPVTLTNHTYFNLTGSVKRSVLNHVIQLESDSFLELDETLAPTGFIRSTAYTPFDFRSEKRIGERIHLTHHQLQVAKNGYDHYFLLDHTKEVKAVVYDEESGRKLEMKTTQPGVVLYTGNSLEDELLLKEGNKIEKHAGLCLETQGHPAALQHKGLSSIWLKPEDVYKHQTIYQFSVE
ncbi:aldose epimerase family protein [Shouchella lehensis]|uniref:Aldose 1-epimerase n=1 Tax=Shouchella lehensis TaxID=300825 RepID=A0A4Y7WG48_9BACI|nr:aldose epimerase family protein [Shouchella lehensis]MBG9785317.1 hypothetical protein [Shouchella lehensis]RQW19050.1 galactose mutarotase [Bacillus sp. C1-1]TES46764.1 galactose mutarotase [Shouchella lehensis]